MKRDTAQRWIGLLTIFGVFVLLAWALAASDFPLPFQLILSAVLLALLGSALISYIGDDDHR